MTDEQRIPVISPEGEPVTLPASQVREALGYGYALPDKAQRHEISQRIKYGQGLGNELRAGAEGAARGLTFGLSDQALKAAGVDIEGLKERKERNEVSAMAGEGLGIGAGLLASGGALGAAGAGVRGVAAAGEAATGATELGLRALGMGGESLAQKVLAKSLAKGVGSAVEGAAYGAGQAVSEDALGDPEALGQNFLAHVGLGAAVGGLGGGAIGALGQVAKTGTKAIGRILGGETKSLAQEAAARAAGAGAHAAPGAVEAQAAPLAGEAAQAAAPVAEGGAAPLAGEAAAAPPPTPTPAQASAGGAAAAAPKGPLSESLSKALGLLSGTDSEVAAKLAAGGEEGALFRRAAFAEAAPERDATIRKLAKTINAQEDIAKDIGQEALGGFKLERIKKVVSGDTEAQLGVAENAIAKARSVVSEIQSKPGVYAQGGANKLAKLANDYEEKIAAISHSGEDVGARTFIALDEFKRKLGPLAKYGKNLTTTDKDAINLIDNLYHEDFRAPLENTHIWGNAGDLQQRVNAKWTDYLKNIKNFGREFTAEGDIVRGRPTYVADPAKLEGYLNNLTKARNDLRHQLLVSHADTQEALLREIRDVYDMGGTQSEKVDQLIGHNAELKKTIGEIEREVTIKNQTRHLMHTKTGKILKGYAELEKALGKRGRGPLAEAMRVEGGAGPTAAAVQHVAQRQEQVAQLAGIERANYKVNKQIKQSINGYLSRLGKAALRGATPASVGAMHRIFLAPGERKGATKHEAYRHRLDELAELTANPAHFQRVLVQNMANLEHAAPRIAGEVQLTAAKAVSFLMDKAPKDPLAAMSLNPRATGWRPSDAELSKFERYLQATQHPLSILHDLDSGTVTTEAAEAVRTVYPALYNRIVKEMIPHLAEKTDVPFQARMQLSTAFGLPVDAKARPQFFASMQQAHNASALAAGPSKPSPNSRNARAAISTTPLQRVTSGA